MSGAEWRETVKALLKAELVRRRLGYRELADKLVAMGVDETSRSVANKLSRGTFSAVFLVQCLAAIGCQTLRLDLEET